MTTPKPISSIGGEARLIQFGKDSGTFGVVCISEKLAPTISTRKWNGLMPLMRQVPMTVESRSVNRMPLLDCDTKQIFRHCTAGRRACSALLLVGSTPSYLRKVKRLVRVFFVRVRTRGSETHKIPLRPAVPVKESIKLLRSTLPTTIEIRQDITETYPILADPTQIHQIMMNLCTNSYHAMEESGGTLFISLKNKTFSRQDLTGVPDVQPGNFVQLSVRDTGSGIAPEIKERVFDPYFTTKAVGKGTGMGLATVHGIVKISGGFVACQSAFGEGTVFEINLPALQDKITPETREVDAIPVGAERLLFVDDEEMLVNMGKAMLDRLGYSVTVQMSSIEALKIFQNQPDAFDLVITDQTMPGMTGFDLARRMLQIRPGLPIILCTGYSNQISEEKVKYYGIKGFVMKPLARKDIAVLVRKILDEEKNIS